MNNQVKFIEAMSNAPGAPGFEDQVVEVVKKYVGDQLVIQEDKMRNLLIYRKDYDPTKPTILLDGHSDEVAFMVQSITQKGMIKFLPLGGWVSQNVGAHRVKVQNREGDYISGIVSSKPPHFMKPAERGQIVEIGDMTIDIGATSYEEAVDVYKITVGAPIVPAVDFEYKTETDVMIGKAFDNRLGCACVVETLLKLGETSLPINVVGAISSQEEIGTRGSVITSRSAKPAVAIVFEGSPADDPYRGPYDSQGALKAGTQIRHRDSSMVSNPRFIKFAHQVAGEAGHKYQDAIRMSGGTNAGAIHLSHEAVPTLVMGIPVRYVHTHYGISAYEDFVTTVNFAVDVIKNLNQEIIDGL